jgi:hypothetical protein
MLRLLMPMLGNRWQIGEPNSSDVVILEGSTLRALRDSAAVRAGTLYVTFEDSAGVPREAFCSVQRPINSARLIEVLHKARAELERRHGNLAATTILPARLRAELSAAERSIEISMRAAVRWLLQNPNEAATVFSNREAKILSSLPGRGYTSRLSSVELADLLRGNPPVRLLSLTAQEADDLLARKLVFGSPGRLEWIYWIAGSNGELRPELFVSKPYRLTTWPDFGRLPHYRSDVRMASLLKSDAMTVAELAERADVRLETACNFVNACCALGYLSS